MQNLQCDGIVVQTYLSGESSLVAVFITANQGKLKAFVPQARKSQRRFSRLDVFDCGSINLELNSKTHLHILKEFKCQTSFPSLRESLDALFCAGLLAEVIENLTPEEDPNSVQNYTILFQALSQLSKSSEARELLSTLQNALFNLIIASGYEIDEKLSNPTVLNLTHLLHYSEELSHKKLRNKDNILNLIRDFKKTIQA